MNAIEKREFKELVKEAIGEVLTEHRELIGEIADESFERAALIRAIQEGEKKPLRDPAARVQGLGTLTGKVGFRAKFTQDLTAITDALLLRRIKEIMEQVKRATTFRDLPYLEPLEERGKYYRIRLGDYRLGVLFDKGTFTFVRCLGREEIYRYFHEASAGSSAGGRN